jgi:hypothetical protein
VIDAAIEGELLGGGKDQVTYKIAAAMPFLVMEGMALTDRIKEKGAGDIYYCITNYPGGIDELVQDFKGHVDNNLVQEGLVKISEKFASPEHVVPKHTADFEAISRSCP